MDAFFFNDAATTEIYTLSLHDALPISISCAAETMACRPDPHILLRVMPGVVTGRPVFIPTWRPGIMPWPAEDRKSTRLNSSHANISYAVFCLKKKILAYALL